MATRKVVDEHIKKVAEASKQAGGSPLRFGTPTYSTLGFEIVGTAPLILNDFSQKSLEQMLRKHMGISEGQEKKKPRELVERAIPRNEKGDVCVRPACIKHAMVDVSAGVKKMGRSQKSLNTMIYIVGGSIPIAFESMEVRMDLVRLQGFPKKPDVRFRPQFNQWSAEFIVRYDDSALDAQTIVDFLVRAGVAGLGEWRPGKGGEHGTFDVKPAQLDRWELITAKCAPLMKSFVTPEWAMDAELDLERLKHDYDRQNDEDENGENAKKRVSAATVSDNGVVQ